MEVVPVQRRRHGTYTEPENSRRQCTVTYNVPDGEGNYVQVCRQTFLEIFTVCRSTLQTLVTRKKNGEVVFEEKRGKFAKPRKLNSEVIEKIKQHINSIPRSESHYSRAKSTKEYLSPDLNIHRLFQAFKSANPSINVSYRDYAKVFKEGFPQLSFRPPRSDTCRTCDRLQCEIKTCKTSPESRIAKTKLEQHHRKSEKAMGLLKDESTTSQMPGSNTSVVCIDLEQVLFVPTLVHSDMFYKRQLSCYNFCVHICDFNKGYMCMWHELTAGRGGNEIVSCLLHVLNSIELKKHLILWSDNCAAQNKNRMMIFLFVYLVSLGVFDIIEQKFLVSGHSYLPCDRDFAQIEKRKRLCKAFVPEELHDIVRSAKHVNQFEVIDMTENRFVDIQAAADSLITTKNLQISKVTMLRFSARKPGVVEVKYTYSEVESWKNVCILKKGVKVSTIRNVILNGIQGPRVLSKEKKEDLLSMVPYLDKKYRPFYENLCRTDAH